MREPIRTIAIQLAIVVALGSVNSLGQASTYPNTLAGLQQQFADILEADRQHDGARVELLVKNLTALNIDQWAADNLPEKYRTDLGTKYNAAFKLFEATLLGQINLVSASSNPAVAVSNFDVPTTIPSDSRKLMTAAGAAPYQITFSGDGVQPTKMIDTFLYQGGAFRFAGQGIFSFLVPQPSGFTPDGKRVSHPKVIYSPNPTYSEEARQRKIQGSVAIGLTVGTDGKPHDLVVKSGDPALADAALDAVRRWRFKPAEVDGQPVETSIVVSVQFRLY